MNTVSPTLVFPQTKFPFDSALQLDLIKPDSDQSFLLLNIGMFLQCLPVAAHTCFCNLQDTQSNKSLLHAENDTHSKDVIN